MKYFTANNIHNKSSIFSFSVFKRINLLLILLALTACGGGDGNVEENTPLQPNNVLAVTGNTQITISWDNDNTATGYDICRATETISQPANCSVHQNGELGIDQSSPATFTGLSNDTEYFFVVIPKNAKGDGTASVVVSATPSESGPITPTTITAIDLLEAVQNGSNAGKWTEAEGITAALNGFSGRKPVTAGLSINNVEIAGLTSLIRRVTELLAGNTLSSTERTELETAMELFTHPSQDILDQISKPSNRIPNISSRPYGSKITPKEKAELSKKTLILKREESTTECAKLGIDQSELGADGKCFIYDELEDDNANSIKVYYPNSYSENSTALELIDLTLDALIKSNNVYSTLATVGDINFVFSFVFAKNEDGEDDGNIKASQILFDPTEESACPLILYLPANIGDSLDTYPQKIAHEVFHCVQNRTFKSYSNWWGEGSAEFFSNLVYPNINIEHRWHSSFDEKSSEENITTMSYHNTVFFQYYANRRGNEGTISLLEGIANAGGTLQSVASITGAKLWQEFVEAFMAGAILDTGGGKLQRGIYPTNDEIIEIGEVGETKLISSPMVATRYLVRYLKQKRIVQTAVPDQGLPSHSVVPIKQGIFTGAWSLLPPEIRTSCNEPDDYLVVTTSVDEQRTFTIDVTQVEEASCDACVLGPWDMRLNTFKDIINAGASGPSGSVTDVQGHYYFDFKETGGFAAFRQPLIITTTAQNGGSLTVKVIGSEIGDYSADGTNLDVSNLVAEAEAELVVTDVDGLEALVGVPTGGSSSSLSGAVREYECVGDVLTIFDQILPPTVLDRIDKIPDPEDVDIEEGIIDTIN